MDKNILYIGPIGVKGTALAVHSRNIAAILKTCNYNVNFICDYVENENNKYDTSDCYNYFYTKYYIKIPKIGAVESLIEILLGIKLFCLFKKKAQELNPNFVIFYGYYGQKKIINYCKKNNIKIVVDRTDWFEASDKNKYLDKFFTRFIADKSMRKYDFLTDGIISISEYFYYYYRNKGQKTIWLPPVFSIEERNEFSKSENSVLNLVYAGTLGKKDTVSPVVNCLIKFFNSEKIQIKLNLVGISQEQLSADFGERDWEKLGIYAHGRVTNKKSREIVSKSDFSLLLRQNKRYAKAGFSTKFAESMSLGVPVICTKVGGADTIITDMIDGVHLTDNEAETIQAKINQLLQMSNEEIINIKRNAYNTALEKFSKDNYTDKLYNFINSL